MSLSRRQFLASVAAAGFAAPALSPRSLFAAPSSVPLSLVIDSRTLDVLGKPAKVYGITGPGGLPGLIAEAGQRFSAVVENRLSEPTVLHWHGQTPPNSQDGVPGLTQAPIPGGASLGYDYTLRPGTHWMHSHHGLQEQRLMAAPMIVREAPNADRQEVVMLLHDFSFTDPAEQFAKLTGMSAPDHATMHHGGQMPQHSGGMGQMDHGSMDHGSMDHSQMPQHSMPSNPQAGQQTGMDMTAMHAMHMNQGTAGHGQHSMMGGMSHANDLDYDAYLANDRTLDDPQVTQVEAGGRVLLRIINGATTTAFFIELPGLRGDVVAVDGNPVQPVPGSRFPIAMGQRLDILLTIPKDGGAWPVLARREEAREQTGIILATKGADIAKLDNQAAQASDSLSLDLESRLTALHSLSRRQADRRLTLSLEGNMMGYQWTLNGDSFGQHKPLTVKRGERVELTFMNHSDMMHPMHLHGHAFQVVALGGRRLAGALRDTVIVPSMTSVTVAFDADNPGEWVCHCHNLFHMAAGMMTTVKYD